MDTIFIQALKTYTIIGIFDWEREKPQLLCFDIEMATDTCPAAQSDSIEQALDYNKVSKRVIQYVESTQFQLIETLAEKVANLILVEFSVARVKITLTKPGAVERANTVGVMIERCL